MKRGARLAFHQHFTGVTWKEHSMKRTISFIAMAAIFTFGVPAVFAADQGMQGQSEKKKTDKQHQKTPGTGPMGEVEKGGSGPSGPQTNAPGKSPGFEGAADKKPGQSPTSGGH
jgi:hypothetical protein